MTALVPIRPAAPTGPAAATGASRPGPPGAAASVPAAGMPATGASAGAPPAGMPSTGAPATGAPATGAPATGTSATGTSKTGASAPPPAAAAGSIRQLPFGALMLIAGNVPCALGFGLIAPALPELGARFNAGATAVAMLVSVCSLARLAFAPVCGSLAHRMGERHLYVAGACLVGVATALCGFAGSYAWLLALRMAAGVGSIMYTVSASTLLIRLTPPHLRGRASGLSHTTFLLGNMAGPAAGGLLVGYWLPLPFVLYGILMVGLGLGNRTLLARDAGSYADPRRAAAATAVRVRDVCRQPLFAAMIASAFVLGWEVYGVRLSLVPLYATGPLRQSPAVAGLGLTLCALGSAAVVLLAGRAADRSGRRVVMLTGLVCCGAALVAMGVLASVAAFLGACVAIGLGAGTAQPALGASVADLIGGRAGGGRVVAAQQMATDIGAFAGPLAAGLMADHVGIGPALAASGILLLAPVGAWLGVPRRPA
jgi:MFS family permease